MTPKRLVAVGLVMVVGGCVLAAIATGVVGDAIGMTIAGIGAVLLISAAFLAIGLSEDRDRARHPGPDR